MFTMKKFISVWCTSHKVFFFLRTVVLNQFYFTEAQRSSPSITKLLVHVPN